MALELTMGNAAVAVDVLPMPADPLKKVEAAAEAREMRKPAAGPPPAKALYDTAKYGPFNNWGQTINYKEVPRPGNYDFKRPTDSTAKLGYLADGRPFSPYGVTEQGKIRTRPVPSMNGRDKAAPGAPGAPAPGRRVAPGDLKPPENVKNHYAALDELHKREQEHCAEIKRLHPETTYGQPVHPRDTGSGRVQLTDPLFTETELGGFLKVATRRIAKALDDKDVIPGDDAIELASKKVTAASRFYGLSDDPKVAATWGAVIALAFVFGPALLCAAGKLYDKIFGDGEEKTE
jgi:hypothetical protein